MKLCLTCMLTWALGSLLALTAWGQPAFPRPAEVAGTAVLLGHVANRTADMADTIAVSIHDNPLDTKERVTYAHLNEKGEFQLRVPVTGSTRADLLYEDESVDLYLDPSTDLTIRFKAEDMPGTIKFRANAVPTGFGTRLLNGANLDDEQRHRQQMANANEYLAEFDAQFVSNDGFQVLPDNILLYEAPFISFIEYRLKHEKNFLEDRAAKQSFTTDFYNYAKAEITYSNINDRLTFADLREQIVTTEARLTMTPGYYDFLHDPSLLSDPTASQNEQFQEFLLNYTHYLVAQQKHLRTDLDFYPVCYGVASKRLSGNSRLLTLGRILQESFRLGHVRQSAALLANFRTLDAKKRYVPALEADFNRHKDLAIGAPAPEFALPSPTGDTVRLSSFQGKLVYLNFWKSANGPCLRDLPYVQDLQKSLAGKDVVFINISFDEFEPSWRQLVAARKLLGVQVWAAGGLHSKIAQAYGLNTVPAYILLGEDGTILTTKPKRVGSRAAMDEIIQSFGKARLYTAAVVPPPSAVGQAK